MNDFMEDWWDDDFETCRRFELRKKGIITTKTRRTEDEVFEL